jgi:hypothetical protein
MVSRHRSSIGQNVGIFVGTSAFHIDLSFWKITSNFDKVAAPAPASQSGFHRLMCKDRPELRGIAAFRR